MRNLVKRLFLEPEQSYFLFGPRGTGKSTMIQARHPEAQTFLLYRGKDKLLKGDILCLPIEKFIRELRPNFSLDDAEKAFPVNGLI